jgi:hypothetical protein
MTQIIWDVIKIAIICVVGAFVLTVGVLLLVRPSDEALASKTNAVVARCGATGQDVTARGWLGNHWNMRCRDSKPYACSGTDVINCAER